MSPPAAASKRRWPPHGSLQRLATCRRKSHALTCPASCCGSRPSLPCLMQPQRSFLDPLPVPQAWLGDEQPYEATLPSTRPYDACAAPGGSRTSAGHHPCRLPSDWAENLSARAASGVACSSALASSSAHQTASCTLIVTCLCRFRGRMQQRSPHAGFEQRTPDRDRTLMELNRQRMLPAIWFLFSRQGCHRAAKETDLGSLITPESEIQIVDALTALECAPRGPSPWACKPPQQHQIVAQSCQVGRGGRSWLPDHARVGAADRGRPDCPWVRLVPCAGSPGRVGMHSNRASCHSSTRVQHVYSMPQDQLWSTAVSRLQGAEWPITRSTS